MGTSKKTKNKKADKKGIRDSKDSASIEEKGGFLKRNNSKILVILFFVVLFGIGLRFLPNVNGNFDENTEQNILLSNVKDYSELLHMDKITDSIHNKGILAISVDPNRDHGIAPYYLFAPILAMKTQYPHFVSTLWHFYTYCLAFVGVVFFYLLMQYLFNNKSLSLAMTMLYFFTPRMFVDSLHNNKDIVFMALLVVVIYYGVRFIKEKKFRWAVLFAIVGAFACNVKILGIFFVGIVGLGYIVRLTIKKEWSKRTFLCGLTAVGVVIIAYLAITPAIWGDGRFALIEYIQYCLENAVNFSADTAVMFEGTIHLHRQNPLPWYYVPKLILVTLPVVISVLFVSSSVMIIIDCVKGLRRKKLSYDNCVLIMVLVMFIVPLGIAIFKNPNLYNGWRHFYFLYSLMLIVGSYVVFKSVGHKKTNIAMSALIGITIIGDVFCLLKYGMANTAYYNLLLGTDNLSNTYELDYYNVSSREALNKFMASDRFEENEDGMIYLYSTGFGEVVIGDMKTYARPEISQRIVLVTDDNVEKYRKKGKKIYNMSNPVYRYNDVSKLDLVFSYKFLNSEVINFYEMD